MKQEERLYSNKLADVVKELKAAKVRGLYFEYHYDKSERDAQQDCDICGKSEPEVLVTIGFEDDRESFKEDPYSGQVYLFGSTCWKKVKELLK